MSRYSQQILMDATSYNAYKQGEAKAVQIIKQALVIHIAPMTTGCLITQFREEAEQNGPLAFDKLLDLNIFLDAAQVKQLVIDRKTGKHFGEILYGLRDNNEPLPINDLWTAALALQHDLLLVTKQPHFAAISGLCHEII